jgi:DNA-binding CsgD family transcriptional regulator
VTISDDLVLARDAFERRAWAEVADRLSSADAAGGLAVDDLERLATARHMLGQREESLRGWERAHQTAVADGRPARAARHAFHLVMAYGQSGDIAQAGGWMHRAMGLVEQAGDCVERGFLLVPMALQALDAGDPQAAFDTFSEAATVADRFNDPDLATFGRLGRGQSLIALGETERGVALLDEAMVAATTGEISPITVGIVYCAAIEAFQAILDLRRSNEWTTALTRWCDSQPDGVPFRGRCLVYRAEILQFHGRWPDAASEVERASEWLSRPPIEPALGEAHYQRAELHRLRGEFGPAETAYREASRWGRRPDPGLALLKLASGDVRAASAMIRRALAEADRLARPRLLEPAVEIELALGDLDAARAAASELRALAERPSSPQLLRAIADRAGGLVLLAEGDPTGALRALNGAAEVWRMLDAPYETARLRVAVGRACQAVGDTDTATLELAAARDVFERLGALPDVRVVDELASRPPQAPGGLTRREVEVLGHVAAGVTNREIAERLGIGERTVDRHVSNIYTKLDVSSRAAATAFAYEHRLV